MFKNLLDHTFNGFEVDDHKRISEFKFSCPDKIMWPDYFTFYSMLDC